MESATREKLGAAARVVLGFFEFPFYTPYLRVAKKTREADKPAITFSSRALQLSGGQTTIPVGSKLPTVNTQKPSGNTQ